MSKFAFVWDYQAAGAVLLRSEGIARECAKHAERMTRATGMEYRPDVSVGRKRVRAGGYQQSNGEDGGGICPKCGGEHPNCRCNARKKRG